MCPALSIIFLKKMKGFLRTLKTVLLPKAESGGATCPIAPEHGAQPAPCGRIVPRTAPARVQLFSRCGHSGPRGGRPCRNASAEPSLASPRTLQRSKPLPDLSHKTGMSRNAGHFKCSSYVCRVPSVRRDSLWSRSFTMSHMHMGRWSRWPRWRVTHSKQLP